MFVWTLTLNSKADETIEHEGDLLGPLSGAELLDKHPFLVALPINPKPSTFKPKPQILESQP